ncbi:hypothetical protein ACIBRY_36795 [Streptomyces anulatus]
MNTVEIAPGLRHSLGRALVLAGVLTVGGCSAAGSAETGEGKDGAAREPSACSLLNADDVRQTFGSVDTFVGTRPDPVEGERPWGCTWGSQTSYVSVEEVNREAYRAETKAPGALLTPQNIGTGDSFAVYPADKEQPMWFVFTTGGRFYHLDVVPSRDGDYPRYKQGDIGTNVLRLLIPAIENTRN